MIGNTQNFVQEKLSIFVVQGQKKNEVVSSASKQKDEICVLHMPSIFCNIAHVMCTCVCGCVIHVFFMIVNDIKRQKYTNYCTY